MSKLDFDRFDAITSSLMLAITAAFLYIDGCMSRMKRLFSASLLGFSTLAMNGCDAIYWDEPTSFAAIAEKTQDQGELRVLTVKGPFTYNIDKTGHKSGIDHDLIESFARHYNFKVRFITMSSEEELIAALSEGRGDIGAARMATPDTPPGLIIGPAYEETYLSLFCKRGLQIENIQDLKSKTVSIRAKDFPPHLEQRLTKIAPQTQFKIDTEARSPQLFQQVENGSSDCLISENLEGQFYSQYYPSTEKISAMTGPYSLNWLVRSDLPALSRLMQAWFQSASREDEIMRIHDRYRLFFSELDQTDVLRFLKESRTVLPRLSADFKHAAREHNIPWQLVAAVCYQESQWDNEAVSYTGVRGLMQLTQNTADHLGIEDRTDPLQSIWGGAKYLRYLLNKTPSYLNFKDRVSLALAAYNIGFGHLRDAQKLAESQGKNPNSWRHLREILPLLENPDYEKYFEYGLARGTETVEFVERVTGFYNLMIANQI